MTDRREPRDALPLRTLYRRIEDPAALLRELGRMGAPLSSNIVQRQTFARTALRTAMQRIESVAAEHRANPKLLAVFVELDALGYLRQKPENSTDQRP